jgi:hypothetical protein
MLLHITSLLDELLMKEEQCTHDDFNQIIKKIIKLQAIIYNTQGERMISKSDEAFDLIANLDEELYYNIHILDETKNTYTDIQHDLHRLLQVAEDR